MRFYREKQDRERERKREGERKWLGEGEREMNERGRSTAASPEVSLGKMEVRGSGGIRVSWRHKERDSPSFLT